jgi:acetyl esterase/lipase
VLIGHSAGAHIAAMLALDPQWLRARGLSTSALRGLVGLAGPYDFHPDTPTRRIIFGLERDRARTQPISFARADAPPVLLVSGRGDRVVDPGNATRLGRRLEEQGAAAEVRFYPYASHTSLIGAFSPALRFVAPVFRDTVDFITRVTTPQPATERALA